MDGEDFMSACFCGVPAMRVMLVEGGEAIRCAYLVRVGVPQLVTSCSSSAILMLVLAARIPSARVSYSAVLVEVEEMAWKWSSILSGFRSGGYGEEATIVLSCMLKAKSITLMENHERGLTGDLVFETSCQALFIVPACGSRLPQSIVLVNCR